MLFTSRNKAPQGLRLRVDKHDVGCLQGDAPKKVLLDGGVKLDDAQLQVALDFCSGLPLALTLLNRALVAEDDPAELIQHLATHGRFSVDKEEELVAALSFSVKRLSEELQTAWLDLAWMYAKTPLIPLIELQCLFGKHTLQQLQNRSLMALHVLVDTLIGAMVEVVVHSILLRMAEGMLGPLGTNHCLALGNTSSISLSPATKVCIYIYAAL